MMEYSAGRPIEYYLDATRTIVQTGTFHRFMHFYQVDNVFGLSEILAIIELPDGTLVDVPIGNCKFTDKGE